MKTAKPGQRVLHPYLGPGTVKALHEIFKGEICYFKPDLVPERHLGLQLANINTLKELINAAPSRTYRSFNLD